jgi:hypothetical protein
METALLGSKTFLYRHLYMDVKGPCALGIVQYWECFVLIYLRVFLCGSHWSQEPALVSPAWMRHSQCEHVNFGHPGITLEPIKWVMWQMQLSQNLYPVTPKGFARLFLDLVKGHHKNPSGTWKLSKVISQWVICHC